MKALLTFAGQQWTGLFIPCRRLRNAWAQIQDDGIDFRLNTRPQNWNQCRLPPCSNVTSPGPVDRQMMADDNGNENSSSEDCKAKVGSSNDGRLPSSLPRLLVRLII